MNTHFLKTAVLLPCALITASCGKQQELRDPYKWPFAATSIWNMPIGSEAQYVHAMIEPAGGMTIDDKCKVQDADCRLVPIRPIKM